MPAATPFLILLGGELSPGPRLAAQIEGARVIAADGGMRHAATLGLVPELWVGDFDSSDTALKARFSGVERVEHPVAKDMTDGELAIEAALDWIDKNHGSPAAYLETCGVDAARQKQLRDAL
mgnify:CR=1 FL=1